MRKNATWRRKRLLVEPTDPTVDPIKPLALNLSPLDRLFENQQ
jgi:hypothetical protein